MRSSTKVYTLRNKETGATIKCSEKFLTHWLIRGFDIISIELRKLQEDKQID